MLETWARAVKPSTWSPPRLQLLQTLGRSRRETSDFSTNTPPLPHSPAVSCRTPRPSQAVQTEAKVSRLGTEAELGIFKQKKCKWLRIEWPQTARAVQVTVTREMESQDVKAAKLPQLTLGPRREGRLRPPRRQLPLQCLGVNNRYTKKTSLNG